MWQQAHPPFPLPPPFHALFIDGHHEVVLVENVKGLGPALDHLVARHLAARGPLQDWSGKDEEGGGGGKASTSSIFTSVSAW